VTILVAMIRQPFQAGGLPSRAGVGRQRSRLPQILTSDRTDGRPRGIIDVPFSLPPGQDTPASAHRHRSFLGEVILGIWWGVENLTMSGVLQAPAIRSGSLKLVACRIPSRRNSRCNVLSRGLSALRLYWLIAALARDDVCCVVEPPLTVRLQVACHWST